MTLHADVAIVGGGPVGASLAAALDGSGLNVVVLEARARLEAPDPRALALSEGTRLILQRLGAWETLAPQAARIASIHVSQRGGFGRAEITADEADVPALGYVAAYGDLYAALAQRLQASKAHVQTGARVTEVAHTAGYGMVRYQQHGAEHLLTARLIVLSEGGKALPAALRDEKDYGQSAVLATVQTERAHHNRAYERFTPQGPIALLPLADAEGLPSGHTYALVWTTPRADLEARLALNDADFLHALQNAFGHRQGRFLHTGPRAAFPLKLVLARASDTPRIVRIGNAAHVLHPVAGQGFNLGVRDAWKLAEALFDTPVARLGLTPLADYETQRRADIFGGSLMTDLLVTGFSNDLPVWRHARGHALAALDMLPPLKTLFARKMMFGAQAW